MDWFDSLIDWLKTLWSDFTEFVAYIPIKLLDGLLNAITTLLSAVPVPDFVSDGLQDVVNEFDPTVKWLIAETNIDTCLQIILAATLFRIARRFLTLGIW